ncbi:MAG: peroxiredoxin [Bacteroidetes bacterium]|nr:peroxiredoxin [Bacteroidota bacterium]
MNYQVGDTIQPFSLQNTDGTQINITDYKGKKVVLLFFPLAFSSVCTDELCSIRDNMKIYESLKADVIALSIDSFFSLKAFKAAQNYNFTMLSDFNKEVSDRFGVLSQDFFGMKGVAKRSAFVLDEQQKIIYSEILEDAGNIPDFKKIQEVLR